MANCLTYQEHTLVGSTQNRSHASDPYKVIGVIEGNLTVDEAQEIRSEGKTMGGLAVYFLNVGRTFVNMTLESLDEEGRTIRDPRIVSILIKEKGEYIDKEVNPDETKYSPNFPFRRD
jgi:stage V sporulation protein SpoVS